MCEVGFEMEELDSLCALGDECQCPPSSVFLAPWGKLYLIVDQGQCEPVSNQQKVSETINCS